MMRNGILLAEDSPANILQKFRAENLEDAFLLLSQKQGVSEEADTTLGRAAGQRALEALEVIEVHANADKKADKIYPKEKEAKKVDDSKKDVTELPKSPLKRNLSFRETKPDGLIGKLTFTSQIRMKALLMKNLLQLIRQPS